MKFTPRIQPIKSKTGKVLYKNPELPVTIKLWKRNQGRIPQLMRAFKLKTRNALINHLIEFAELYLEIGEELKAKGSFQLNAETAKKFGIRL